MANKTFLSAILVLLGSALLSPGTRGQTKAPLKRVGKVPSIKARRRTTPVQVDGFLREWAGYPSIQLRHRSQLDLRKGDPTANRWKGPGEDLSGEIFLAWDETDLYLAGRVVDQKVVPPPQGAPTWMGDALEIFLNTDLQDDLGPQSGKPCPLDKDDYQIFLLPAHPSRPWGVVRREGPPGKQVVRLVDMGWTGVEVAFQMLPGGYAFEARFPFHNFRGLKPGTGVLGFNVALGDHDPPEKKYTYMVWTGIPDPFRDTRGWGRLLLDPGVVLMGRSESGPGLWEKILGLLQILLFPLVFLGALAGAYQLHLHFFRERVRLRRAAFLVSLALVLGGLFLPRVLTRWRELRVRNQLKERAERIGKLVEAMSGGTLASYKGARRDKPLLDLLSGKTVARVPDYRYQPVDLGPSPVRFPDAQLVKPYGIPLQKVKAALEGAGPGEPLKLEFRKTYRKGRLLLTFTFEEPALPGLDARGPKVEVRLVPGLAAKGAGEAESLVLDLSEGPQVRETELLGSRGDPGRSAGTGEIEIPEAGVRGLEVKVLEGAALRLEGVTWVSPDDVAGGVPLSLGRTTLSGVPTDLYLNHPADAGALLLPGEEKSWTLPRSPYTPGWDRAWILLSGISVKSPAPQVSSKDVVARVRFLPAKSKGRPVEWKLLHQNHVFFELSEENERLGALEKGETPAEVAFRWNPEDSPQEQRLTVIISHPLPRGTRLERMVFKNVGPYPIHVWGLVLGLRKALRPSEGGDSPLRTTPEGDKVCLKEEAAALVEGFHFALYRDGILQPGCTLPDVNVEGARMPRRGRKALETQTVMVGKCRLTSARMDFEAFVPLKGKGWGGTVLSVIGEDPGLESYKRVLTVVGLLLAALAMPFLFVSFLQGLMGLRTLRAKLVGSLTLAAALPLLLFSLFLVKVLEEGHKERETDRLRGELRSVLDHFAKQKASLAEEAKVRFQAVLKSIREKYPPGKAWDPGKRAELAAFLQGELQKLRSAEWGKEAFLRMDVGFLPGRGPLDSPLVVYDRPESRRLGESASPLSGVTFQLRWGVPFLSARTVPLEGGGGKGGASISLALGIPLDGKILSRVAGRSSVVLYDMAGYPLAWAGGAGEETLGPEELVLEREPSRMEEKRRIAEDLLEGRNVPGVFLGGGKAGVFQVLKDGGGMPRAILGVLEPAREPVLSLALLGDVEVARFFGSVGAAILALVFFVGWVVTDRVSRPLERLREGTARVSRGELEVRLPAGGNDEVAELSRAFNKMAQELQERIRDTESLNRALRDFTTRLDMAEVGLAAASFLEGRVGPAGALVVVLDREEEPLVVDTRGKKPWRIARTGRGFLEKVLELREPALLEETSGADPLVEKGRYLVFPLVMGDRALGAILLGRGGEGGNRQFLEGLAGQAAVALENARLFRLAIEDPLTGAYVATYFRERLAQEVDRARRSGRPLSLVRLSLDNLEKLAERRGPVAAARVVSAVARVLKAHMEPSYLLGWLGRSDYEILLPERDKEAARSLAHTLKSALEEEPVDAGIGDAVHLKVSTGVVSCPEDAQSAEFLEDEAERLLVRSRKRAAAGGDATLPAQKVAAPEVTVRGMEVAVKSDRMQALLRTVEKIASTQLGVLLLGETGVGKEVFADLIHNLSDRADGPLIKVNCSAFPETLLESELFGHEKGAFTGAVSRKRGRFELADGGTLFLDEVGEMGPSLQVKLLRFLQDRKFERLGGSEPLQVDVRILAATNRDLEQAIREGTFREDLYYRLKVVTLVIPPLRERKEDIPVLVEIFRRRFCRESGKHVAGFSAEAMDRLHRYSWPGNVRELQNVVTRAMYLASSEVVEAGDLLLPEGKESREGGKGGRGRAQETQPRGADKGRVVSIPREKPERTLPSDLPERLRKLYQILAERGSLTTGEYVKITGLSRKTGQRDLARLVELGFARRRGEKKGRVYEFLPPS